MTNQTLLNESIKSYRDLYAWKKAYRLTKELYIVTKTFPKEEVYGITQQARRAVVSVAANIAEGHARNHRKEFLQFLGIAQGSLAELETYVLLSIDFGYIEKEAMQPIWLLAAEVGKLINGLMNSLATPRA